MISLYCGDWQLVPEEIRRDLTVPSWTTETQLEMFNHGKEIMSRTEDYSFFTNNDHILYGMRIAVKDRQLQDNPRDLRIVFCSADHPNGYWLYIDCDGNMNSHPPGFFDQAEIALLQLF